MNARDLILSVIEDECFEGHYDHLDGAGVPFYEWWECIECYEQATDIELVDHDKSCIVGRVEDVILSS